jgi:esterase/lipase superfamily enzyme
MLLLLEVCNTTVLAFLKGCALVLQSNTCLAQERKAAGMNREYHKWYSPSLQRDMELTVFGHAGARVIVFPTQSGRFFDWEDRGMMNTLSRHMDNGWLQCYCLDSVDQESWDNGHVHPRQRAERHLRYHDYVINEVLPFSKSKNDNAYVIGTGASMGAYHVASIGLRFPEHFNRILAMSGCYDIRPWTGGYDDEIVYQGNPYEFIRGQYDGKLDQIRKMDIVIVIGKEDPAIRENREFSQSLWNKDVWHAFREWDGFAHDWPYWHKQILMYLGGPESND